MDKIACHCGKPAVKEKLCRTHYIESSERVYCDNTDLENLGIVQWLKDMFPEHFRDEFSKFHKEALLDLLNLYDPLFTNRHQRQKEKIWYRGAGKSKTMMGLFAYIIAHNRKKITIRRPKGDIIEIMIRESFMVIASETGSMAETFVLNLRTELSTNPMIRYFYKFIIEDATEDSLNKEWTKRAFRINNLNVLGVGQGMQIRGRVKGAYRITFILFDDIYSENNTKTEDSRANIKSWFDNAAINTVDDVEGKAVVVNTIVHEDTVVVELTNNPAWEISKVELMPPENFRELVKDHMEVNLERATCKLPFDEITDKYKRIPLQEQYFSEIKKDYGIAWSRTKLYDIALRYQEAVYKRAISGFYQEFFHIIISQENKRFLPQYFKPMPEYRLFRMYSSVWFECKGLYDKPQVCNVEFGIDTASGTIDGDDTCITIVLTTPDQRRFVLGTFHGKYGMRDIYHNELKDNKFGAIELDRGKVLKIGFIDEAYRLSLVFNPSVIKIGVAGQEAHFPEEFERVFRANGNYETQIMPIKQTVMEGKKHERIRNILIGWYESGMVYHVPGLVKLEHQLEYLSKANEDDVADATATAFVNLRRVYEIDYDGFENPRYIYKKKLPFPLLHELRSPEMKNEWRVN